MWYCGRLRLQLKEHIKPHIINFVGIVNFELDRLVNILNYWCLINLSTNWYVSLPLDPRSPREFSPSTWSSPSLFELHKEFSNWHLIIVSTIFMFLGIVTDFERARIYFCCCGYRYSYLMLFTSKLTIIEMEIQFTLPVFIYSLTCSSQIDILNNLSFGLILCAILQ